MAGFGGAVRLGRASRRALRRARRPAYWRRELTAGRELEPAYFSLLLRWFTWLIALLLIGTGVLLPYNMARAPALLVLTGLWLMLQSLYLPVLRTGLRSAARRYPRLRTGLERVERGALLSAAEVLLAGPIIYLTGGYGSPFYLYGLSSVVMPALLFGYRAALAAGAGFGALYLLAVLAVPEGASRVLQPGAVDGLIAYTVVPVPFALFAAYLGRMMRQLKAARDRSRRALDEVRLLQAVTAAGLRHVAAPDRFVDETLRLVQHRRWLRAGAILYRRPGAAGEAAAEAVRGFGPIAEQVAALRRGERVDGRTVLTLPLRQGERDLGCLLAEAPGIDAWRPFLTALAGQLSAALANAHLYAEIEALAAQAERARLAREIHDGIAQSLFMLTLNLEACQELVERDPARLRERLELLTGVARQTLWETRHYINDLKPLLAYEQGLRQAIENQVAEFRTLSGLAVELTVEGEEAAADPAVRQALYRIAQEGLANAFKHARARRVEVALRFEAAGVGLTIADDGAGLPAGGAAQGRGLGLRHIRERATELGGRLTLVSAPGEGTRLEVWAPYRAGAAGRAPQEARAEPPAGGGATRSGG